MYSLFRALSLPASVYTNRALNQRCTTRQMTKPSLMNTLTKNKKKLSLLMCFPFCTLVTPKIHRNSYYFIWIFLCSRASNASCIIMRNYVRADQKVKLMKEKSQVLSPYSGRCLQRIVPMLMKASPSYHCKHLLSPNILPKSMEDARDTVYIEIMKTMARTVQRWWYKGCTKNTVICTLCIFTEERAMIIKLH